MVLKMKDLEIKRRLIAEALLRELNEVEDSDIERLNEYISINQATDGKDYYWYFDCDNAEAVADMDGNIIEIEDTEKFFGI